MLAVEIPFWFALLIACVGIVCALVLGMILGGRYALADFAPASSGPSGPSGSVSDDAAPSSIEGR
jgi:hypothetical protein